MIFKQFYLGCLAHASYLIGDAGEAAVVDPQRDIEQYLAEAARHGLQIKYVIETHLHADFVSGHLELAERTGAEIVFGQRADAAFVFRAVHEGDSLTLGAVTLRFLETPGHTPESISILVTDNGMDKHPPKVLTGDTLFIGDVGRPDLVAAKGFTAAQMAELLYDSLHQKLLTLPDAVEVYPAHGAGSLCGRNIGQETSSTIGQQRQFNYALQPMSKAAFVEMMTTDLPVAPAYFAQDVELNRTGAAALHALPALQALRPDEMQAFISAGAVVLDVRPSTDFLNAHVPGSLNIGLNGQFASWVGSLVPLTMPVVLVVEDDVQAHQVLTRLARVGHEQVKGYLAGGLQAWERVGLPLAQIAQITVDELQQRLAEDASWQVLDVRQPSEFAQGHVPRAINVPLVQLSTRAAQFAPAPATALICAGGYRSSAGVGLLAQCGFTHLFNVVGGMTAWTNAKLPLERAPIMA